MMTDQTVIVLAKGAHDNAGDCGSPERCLFEWYNWLTRKKHTDDRPPGVSSALHVYGMRLNDALGDAKRQELVRFLPNGEDRLAGTADDGREETRGYIALDWLIRTYLPTWLDLAGLTVHATALRDQRRIADLEAARAVGPLVLAAGAAARAAARAAPWDAARAAPWDAPWDAARAAPWDAPWDAAGAAARAALAPTVAQLQDSAIALYDQMIIGEWATAA